MATADLWSVDRQFYTFSPRAAELFRDDAITTYLRRVPMPYRVLDAADAYPAATLMAYRIPSVLGYHGNELRAYRELADDAHGYRNLSSPGLLSLLGVRFVIVPEEQSIAGFKKVVGPVVSTFGAPAVLYEREGGACYVRVASAAVKVPEAQIPATLSDARFPVQNVVLYPDTSTITTQPLALPIPASSVTARVTDWQPGRMHVRLAGSSSATAYLVVSENWYPDWHATVDGQPVPVRRGDYSLLSIALPPGGRFSGTPI